MSEDFLLRPLDAPPAYAAVVERVRRAVALGVLLPGDRLPSERALAEGLGVSRVTVREALRVLQGERLLITKRGNGGTVVAPTVLRAGDDPDGVDYGRRLDDVFELRLAVESMAARLAAERGRPEDLDALDACQRALQSSTDVHTFRRADSEFHLAVARMSGNSMLSQVIEDARAAAFSRLDRQDFAVLHETSIRGHATVIEAIRDRDGDAAAAAMVAHLEVARDEVTAVLSTRERPDVRTAG